MRRAALSALALATVAAPLAATPALAADPASAYDFTHTGARATTADTRPARFVHEHDLAFTLADLAEQGVTARITTTIDANAQAANWTTDGSLDAVGFVRLVTGETFVASTAFAPAHDGDPVAWAQDNSGAGPGTGFCANDQFFVNSSWVFGDGIACGIPHDDAAQTATTGVSSLRFVVTLDGDGDYTIAVTPLDADGEEVTSFASGGAASFSGQVAGATADTAFVPFVRVRPGGDTGGNEIVDPDGAWVYGVSTDLVLPVRAPAQGDPQPTVAATPVAPAATAAPGLGVVQVLGTSPVAFGSTITFQAPAADAWRWVDVWAYSTQAHLGRVQLDGSGRASVALGSLAAGSHRLVLTVPGEAQVLAVGDLAVAAAPVVVAAPVVPAAAPAQLAVTGTSTTGLLVAGALVLAGTGATLVARRRLG